MARKFKSRESEYKYYVKMINKGLERIRARFPDSRLLERYSGEFTGDDYSKEKLKKARDLYRSKAVTVDREQRSINAALHTIRDEMGIKEVNRRNLNSFFRFLDDARARGLGAQYSSEQLIEAIAKMKKQKMKKSDIEANIQYWAEKNIKYDREGKLIEPDEYRPLKVLKTGSKRLAAFKQKLADRIRRERRGG